MTDRIFMDMGMCEHALGGIELPGNLPVAMAISLDSAGDMRNDLAKRHNFLRKFPMFAKNRFILPDQSHSRNIELVTSDNNDSRFQADGLLTALPGFTLAVTVADCLPLFVFDDEGLIAGVLHSGWRGTGILVDAFDRVVNMGISPERLNVVIGPGIGVCCYAVDEERAEAMTRLWGSECIKKDKGHYFLDLKMANIGICVRYGIRQVTTITDCTCCRREYGSYRRQGAHFTRMLAMIRLA